ncbi:O-antigen ligase family protein [Aquiflexum gelatinilyticum]|uniref:O-antigen ligase family protein n=1 Tax=Aquiflexum gelatinilyticum TaxID=2961943 RepID=A0A9X2P8G2_9BACT|nr:O-antigen ligase family protein [Aquiflexum gelatinilyticum]MCR9016243.1 O-antigen ligase family protein [Aquiflexum gelatinilyticum]
MIAQILFILALLGYAPLLYYTLKAMVFKGKWEYVVFFLAAYLPFHITFLSIVFQATSSAIPVTFFQLAKDLMVILSVLVFVLYQRKIFEYPFRLHAVDWLVLSFIGLAFLFLLLPLGDTTIVNKALYFKNLLIPAMVYFIGRNTVFEDLEIKRLFQVIFVIAVSAFSVNILEGLLNTHLQNYTGYALFNQVVNNMEPSGNFGLSWTFETQAVTKRFASFFSDPLELASSVLLGFAAGLIWFLTSKREDAFPYLLVMASAMGSLFFAGSRAAFAAFFIMIFFIAVIFKLNRLILFGFSLVLLFVIFVIFFASEDFYYFVVDTLTFQNASSVGHVLEWLNALESMIENPFGVGLAMSGNSGSVSEDARIGGENQFLIYGVQMGFLGMFLYIFLLGFSIRKSIKVFRETENVMSARIAFTAAAVKTGLLLPLFTANAELYTYVSWISWWMVGYTMNEYSKILKENA